MDNKKIDSKKNPGTTLDNDISKLEKSVKSTNKSEIDKVRIQEDENKNTEIKTHETQLEVDNTSSALSSYKDTVELQNNIWWMQNNSESTYYASSNSSEVQTSTPWNLNTTDNNKWFFLKIWDNMKEHPFWWLLGIWATWWLIYWIRKKFKKDDTENSSKETKKWSEWEDNETSEGAENKDKDTEWENNESVDEDKKEKEERKEEKKEKKKEKKKKWSKEKSDKDSEKKISWRKKWLLWAWWILWIWALWTRGYKNWNAIKWWFKEKLWKGLTVEEAASVATGEVSWWLIDESPFRYKFEDWIQYDSQKHTIKSYGRETKINPTKKIIEWFDDIVFPDNKELVHAANIVNCLKLNFHSRCYNNQPFLRSDWWWWDLTVHLANNKCPECLSASDTNVWAWTWWITWTVLWGILWWYCWWPWWIVWGAVWGGTAWTAIWNYFDNNSSMWKTVSTIASWENFQKFIAHLNDLKTGDWKSLWACSEDKVESNSPIQDVWEKVLEDIKNTYSESWQDFNRDFDIKQDENNPSRFLIESYNETVPLIIDGCTITWDQKLDYSKIRSIKIGKYNDSDWWEWLEIDFSHDERWLSEAIRTANLTNKIRKEFHDKWWVKYPFWVKMYGYHRHLQINDKWFRWRDVIYRKTLWEKFPTIFEDLKKQINVKDQEKLHQQAYSNNDQEWCWSKYIKYLHQMREQNGTQCFWKKDN